MDEKIRVDVEKGNLQVFALIGLKSAKGPEVLQNYINNTGDVQTAAYISTYIATALSSSGKSSDMTSVSKALVKASEGPENVFLAKQVRHLRRFIQAYRDMLNQLQLWNVRATFDVTWNQLDKKYP